MTLGADDLLFIHTAGHGGTSYAGGGQYLRLRASGSDRYFSFQMKTDIQGCWAAPVDLCWCS